MTSFGREPEMFGQRVEPAPAQRRREAAREPERAQHRVLEPHPEDPAELEVEKREIELRVVRDHHRVAQKIAERRQHALDRRRARDHLVGDRRKPRDKGRDRPARTHQRRERFRHPRTFHPARADFGDRAGAGTAAGSLEIDHHVAAPFQRHLQRLMRAQRPHRARGVEDEIRIGVEQAMDDTRAEFGVGAGAAKSRPTSSSVRAPAAWRSR